MTDQSFPAAAPMAGLRYPLLWAILTLWFIGVMATTQSGVFLFNDGEVLPLPLALAAALPPLVYLGAYRAFAGLRSWVAGLDLALIVGAQAWRVIGVVFLMLWGLGQLPTVFALTAGLGDLAVGILAAAVAVAVARRAAGWERQVRVLFFAGMVDFVAAFGTAILSGPGLLLLLPGEAAPELMQSLPMAMIPAFGVPLFIILHLMSWQKLRQSV